MKMVQDSQKPFRIFAHRGASGHAPGNSLRALNLACEMHQPGELPWIEVDVRRIGNRLFLLHDGWIETSLGLRQTLDLSLAELASAMPTGESPLLLEQALTVLHNRARLNIEIKDEGSAALVADVLDRYVSRHGWQYDDLLLSSFHQPELAQLHWLQPAISLGVLIAGVPLNLAMSAEMIGAESLHVSADCVTRPLVKNAHDRGLSVYAYTVNDLSRWEKLAALDVDGLFTDYPDRFLRIQQQPHQQTTQAA